MSEQLVRWISVGAILGIVGLVYKYGLVTERQLPGVIIILLALGIVYRIIARRCARQTVLRRRRMYKDLWAREPQAVTDIDQAEENAIVLLGRIKGAKSMVVIMLITAIGALVFKANSLALALALGQLYLAGHLHFIARSLERILPDDTKREPPIAQLPYSPSGEYLVDINLRKVHDFISPPAALPFWDICEVEQWLVHCGFKRTESGKWKAGGSALSHLNADEVISIEPIGH